MSMELSRRSFFGGAAALLASAASRSYAAAVGAGKPNLKFGVLSDIHISPAAYMKRYLLGDPSKHRPRETDLFERALAYFDERGADAVLVAGDLADWGLVGQMKAATDCWWRRFPDGRSRLDGRKVELLAVLGNHDVSFRAWTIGKNYATPAMGPAKIPDEDMFRKDVPRHWQELFHEPYAPIWQKTVKGYTFIGAHWSTDRGIDAVEPYMAERGPALKGVKPFFFIQHPHPRDTCFGAHVSGHDAGQATRALSPYPNAVAISGHAHRPLTDERNVWQGAFTSIGAATLDSLTLDAGRENGPRTFVNGRLAMPALRGRKTNEDETSAAHGLFVNVYDGFLEVERREFVEGRPLGDNWVIPVPAGEQAPFRFDVRGERDPAPGPFPDEALVAVRRAEGCVRLEFPAARNVRGAARTMEYEVEATVEEGDVKRVVFRRHVYAPGVFKAAELEPKTVVAAFHEHLFPKEGIVRFSVRARSAFGRFNAPIFGSLGRVLARRSPSAPWQAYETTEVSPPAEGVKDAPEDRYGGWQVPVAPPTGFFRTIRADGRWWFADPLGNRYLSKGMAVFTPGTSPRQKAALKTTFGTERNWAESELKMLKAHGFNSLGAWSKPGTLQFRELDERMPYTVILSPLAAYRRTCQKKENPPENEIGYHGYPFDFPYVFDPEFDASLEETLSAAANYADDPWLIGYFIDNEIGWERNGLRLCLERRSPDHRNRRIAEAWLEERKGRKGCTAKDVTDRDCRDFLAHCLETYLAKVAKALKRHDPNHLFLGCRFNRWEHELGMEEMFRVAGRYMDVVSVNHYGHWEPDEKTFQKWERWSGKPILVTEFYAKGDDSGLPNRTGGGWIVQTQEDRGTFYANFIDKLVHNRVCVGWHWFKYMDNDPTDLTTDPSNRDSNKGVVGWDLKRYEPLLSRMKAANGELYSRLFTG